MDHWRMAKMGYNFQVAKHCPYRPHDLPNRIQCLLLGYLVTPSVGILRSNTGNYFFSHFKCFLLAGSYGNSKQVIVQKILILGHQERPSFKRNFQGADFKVFIWITQAQNSWIGMKFQSPLCSGVGGCKLHCVVCKRACCRLEKNLKNYAKSKFML